KPLREMILSKLKTVPVLAEGGQVVSYRAVGQGCEVFFAINLDLEKASSAEMSASGEQGTLFELGGEAPVRTSSKDGRLTWKVELPPARWKVFLRRPATPAKIQTDA